MVNFSNNVAVVISTLETYRYGSRIIEINRKCLEDVFNSLKSRGETTFMLTPALEWCESISPKYLRSSCKLAVSRLDDVYKHGRVLGNHIVIYAQPSEVFLRAIDDYLDEIGISGNHTEIHLKNIRHAVTQLCCFAQYNGVGRPEDIGYDLLDAYDSFMRESSKAFYINEGLTVGFLAYMSSSRKCSRGLSLYMHYLESNKVSRLSGLSYHSREMIKNAQKNGTGISADELYTTMEDFVKQMTESGYSHTVTDSVKYHLILLFPFLDMGNLRYNRTTVEIWFKEEGERLFKKGILMARRTYEMYDDYIRDRVVVPSHWWKHGKNMSDRLPSWCLEWIEPFIAAKEKEGWAKNTIKMYHTCITCFCTFLTSAGIVTLDEITPKLIKEYHAWDCGHKTPEAKNAYNSRIRKFLIFLEINGVIPVGVHHALPRHVADREVIVEVLSDKDVLAIETYCKDAQTPIQLRDAAMLMLLKETGLRSCDVIGLRVTDIDWKQRSIRIIQRKTGMEHIHPLSTKAGNQLFRYIRDGRQKDTECTELFTVHKYTMLDAERMKLCPLSLSETGLLLEGRYRHD